MKEGEGESDNEKIKREKEFYPGIQSLSEFVGGSLALCLEDQKNNNKQTNAICFNYFVKQHS